jgi:pyridoxal phosphate enzyme (YggS family)
MNGGFFERLEAVRGRIEAAARLSGRQTEDVTLVAVTKTHPDAVVQEAYAAGVRDFGENRVEALRERCRVLELPGARWHMIGHVQSRRAKELVGYCDLLHSLDSLSLAQALSRRMQPLGADEQTASAADPLLSGDAAEPLDVMLQVNVSGEESKGGWRATTEAEREAFLAEVETVAALPGLRVRGLMTMAPFYENPERTRPIFARLRKVQEALRASFPALDVGWLSTGMTNDYEIAIEEGATHVRVGTALFGERV